MSVVLVDRPVLEAVARGGENDPRWLRRPSRPGGFGAFLYPRAAAIVPLGMPISAEGEIHRDAFKLFLPEKYAPYETGSERAAVDAALEALRDLPRAGAAIVLGGHWNHFHWLHDFLPRLGLFADRSDLGDVRIIVHGDTTAVQWDSLRLAMRALGIEDVPVERTPPGTDLVAVANLIAPLRIGRDTAVAFWRGVIERSGLPLGGGGRRLLVRRGNVARRRLIGEERLAERLAAHGFETIDPGAMSFAEQVKTFAAAAIVVGVHGAALSNMVFAPASATLVELRARQVMDGYRELALAAGQRHVRVLVPESGGNGPIPARQDLELSEAALKQIVPMIVAQLGG